MNSFDIQHQGFTDHFAKANPQFLKSIFGTDDLMPLWIADMDFQVAPTITKELQRLVDRSIFAYEFNAREVFKAIANWNHKRHGLSLNPKSFIQVSGVLTGIGLLIRELSDEGDGIMVQTPVYHQFFKIIKTANREVVANPLKIVDGKYEMDFDDIEQKFSSKKVKAMILCNPHNPVGRVWNREELKTLVQLANTYNVTIISDEIHSDIIYSGTNFNSIVSIDLENHIAVIGSPAKTFGMQSISNGYLYIPNNDKHQKVKHTIESLYLDHGNAFSTFATLTAYTKGGEWLDELLAYLEKTKNWIQSFVSKELPQIAIHDPEGTYQMWMDFSGLQLSEEKLKELIFKKAKLGLTPGEWFGSGHTQYMRINIASPLSKIQKAFRQLKSAVNEGI